MAASPSPLRNVFWLAGERLVRASLTATVLGFVARHLAPAGFGRLSLAITAAAIAAALANLGLEGLVVGELVRRPGREGAVLGTALRLRLAAGAASALLLLLAIELTPSLRSEAPLVAIVALGLLFQPAEVVDLWFQRHLESRRTVIVRLIAVSAGAVLKLDFVARDAGVAAFAWAQAAEAALFAAGLGWAYRRRPRGTGPWSWDPQIALGFWRRGAPLAAAGLVVALSLRFDQLLVRAWLGEHTAGIYFSAARLTEIALFAGTATTLSLFPALAASHAQAPELFRGRLQAMFDALSALGWVVAIGFTVLGPLVIRLLYGPAYAPAGTILVWQGWACLFALSAGARWQFILLEAPTSVNLAAALLSIATQLLLGLWLVPIYGAAGMACAWLAAAVASGFLTSFLFRSLRACAAAQARGLLIPFAPSRWRSMIALFSA